MVYVLCPGVSSGKLPGNLTIQSFVFSKLIFQQPDTLQKEELHHNILRIFREFSGELFFKIHLNNYSKLKKQLGCYTLILESLFFLNSNKTICWRVKYKPLKFFQPRLKVAFGIIIIIEILIFYLYDTFEITVIKIFIMEDLFDFS